MRTQRRRTWRGMFWIVTVFLAGCHTAQPSPVEVKKEAERADVSNEARGVAEAALGKQAEVLAHGNLAQNGREQLLVINRYSAGAAAGGKESNPSMIFLTRAAILEQNDGKWSEVLLCDEHLKNPRRYLGRSWPTLVTGWRLEYTQDPKEGLEIKF